jgi:hypothetical protein
MLVLRKSTLKKPPCPHLDSLCGILKSFIVFLTPGEETRFAPISGPHFQAEDRIAERWAALQENPKDASTESFFQRAQLQMIQNIDDLVESMPAHARTSTIITSSNLSAQCALGTALVFPSNIFHASPRHNTAVDRIALYGCMAPIDSKLDHRATDAVIFPHTLSEILRNEAECNMIKKKLRKFNLRSTEESDKKYHKEEQEQEEDEEEDEEEEE